MADIHSKVSKPSCNWALSALVLPLVLSSCKQEKRAAEAHWPTQPQSSYSLAAIAQIAPTPQKAAENIDSLVTHLNINQSNLRTSFSKSFPIGTSLGRDSSPPSAVSYTISSDAGALVELVYEHDRRGPQRLIRLFTQEQIEHRNWLESSGLSQVVRSIIPQLAEKENLSIADRQQLNNRLMEEYRGNPSPSPERLAFETRIKLMLGLSEGTQVEINSGLNCLPKHQFAAGTLFIDILVRSETTLLGAQELKLARVLFPNRGGSQAYIDLSALATVGLQSSPARIEKLAAQ